MANTDEAATDYRGLVGDLAFLSNFAAPQQENCRFVLHQQNRKTGETRGVPVGLMASRVFGVLRDGDEVTVHGVMRDGVLHPVSIVNHTLNDSQVISETDPAQVMFKGLVRTMGVMPIVWLLLVLLIFGGIGTVMVTSF